MKFYSINVLMQVKNEQIWSSAIIDGDNDCLKFNMH